jgi:hypothetical protein
MEVQFILAFLTYQTYSIFFSLATSQYFISLFKELFFINIVRFELKLRIGKSASYQKIIFSSTNVNDSSALRDLIFLVQYFCCDYT